MLRSLQQEEALAENANSAAKEPSKGALDAIKDVMRRATSLKTAPDVLDNDTTLGLLRSSKLEVTLNIFEEVKYKIDCTQWSPPSKPFRCHSL
jgi:hypothetical protein